MGCTQSKIENEEAVTRCKDRKLFMKDAVSYRNAFAAAHSAYVMSLKNTGAALSDYAHGEVQSSLLTNPASTIITTTTTSTSQGFDTTLPPPPPPLPNFPPTPLQRAVTMPEIKIPKPDSIPIGPIIEEEDEAEIENDGSSLKKRSSSRRGGGSNRIGTREVVDDAQALPSSPKHQDSRVPMPMPQQDSTWDYFFGSVENMPGPSLSGVEEDVRINKDEIERKAFEERPKRVSDGGEVSRIGKVEAPLVAESVLEPQTPPATVIPTMSPVTAANPVGTGKSSKRGKVVTVSGLAEGKRGMKANVNLLQIFIELDDHFLKASECAHEVSKMLEATRLHYHSNFADNRGHIDHSARVMRVITWNRSFRGIPNMDDGKDDFDSEEHETHATVLDKLLAWEKKLYDEVKAGELMKLEYQKKVALLNKQKKRGSNSESLEKTKAVVSHLHTRYIVDMQSMDSTVSEINRLRDDQLYPKLVQLVDGKATMWETMRLHHERQRDIVAALRSLDISQSPKETTEHHHERTIQLWAVVREWHSQFVKLVDNQKGYIKELNNWLKLNLIPIESSLKEKVSSPPRIQEPPILKLLHAWNDYLEKLPDESAKSAIYNFAAVMHTIVQHQDEEIKLKEKCEHTRKELSRKTRQFEEWYQKYMERRIPDEADPGRGDDNTHKEVVERQFAVDMLKKRLEEEDEAYQKQCLQVREKSLSSLKTRLPELFRAMIDIASDCSKMYDELRSISQRRHQNEGSL